MTETEKSYIAGLFDGEGSVGFFWPKASKNGKRYGKLTVRISQNDRAVLDWVQERFGFGRVYRRKSGREGQHDFKVTNEAARVVLATIRPYLIVKAVAVDAKLLLDQIHCRRRKCP